MDRAIETYAGDIQEDRGQEMRELGLAHLTAGHRELPRFDRTQTADVPIDRDVVGRISKYDPRALFSHEFQAARRMTRIRAQQLVLSKVPNVAEPGDSLGL